MSQGKNMFSIAADGTVELLEPAAKRALSVAERYADHFTNPETGLVDGDESGGGGRGEPGGAWSVQISVAMGGPCSYQARIGLT